MAVARRRRIPSIDRRLGRGSAYVFVVPSMLLICIFVLLPVALSVLMSVQNFAFGRDSPFVGLEHYTRLLHDPAFLNALLNTLYYALLTIPASVGLGLFLALVLNQRIRGREIFRTVFFLPVIVPLGIAAIPWLFIMNPDIGWAYKLLASWGIKLGGWVRDPTWAMPAVAIVGIWKNFGFFMVLYLAGLQSIPRQLYETASLDGAGRVARFRHVTWPLLANTTLFVLVVSGIGALQAFDQIFVMTRGGPFFKTETLVAMIYRVGFVNFEFSYAAALSVVLLLVVLGLSVLQIAFFTRREVRY